MKHHIAMAIGLLFLNLAIHAQTCLPGGATFTTQAQIDNFSTANPGCTQIEGNVFIQGADITNLNSLSVLQRIGGDFNITQNGVLANLSGLNNLASIGGAVRIQNNPALTDLDGLESLKAVRGDYCYISDNSMLTSISGLGNLDSIAGIFQIWSHSLLTTLSGLENLEYVGQDLAIFKNTALTDLDGLDNLARIGGALRIYENDVLASMTSLEHPVDIQGALVITDNPALSACDVEAVCTYLMAPASFVAFSGNATGCNADTEVIANCISPAPDLALASQIRIAPNPVSEVVSIHSDTHLIKSVHVRDAMGRSLFRADNDLNRLNLSSLASGIYLLEILIADELVVKRVVKQ